MKKDEAKAIRENAKLARTIGGPQSKRLLSQHEQLREYSLSVGFGDIQQLSGRQQFVEAKLIRRPGAIDFDWLNELVD